MPRLITRARAGLLAAALAAFSVPALVPSPAAAWWYHPGWHRCCYGPRFYGPRFVVGVAPSVVVVPPAVVVVPRPVVVRRVWIRPYWNGAYWVRGYWR